MSSISEERAVNHGIDEESGPDTTRGSTTSNTTTVPSRKSGKSSIRVSSLPINIQESAVKLDRSGDGALTPSDVGFALQNLDTHKKENKNLKMALAAFCFLTVLLVGCIFAASITAARLSKDITVSPETGFAYVKGSKNHEVMKTSEAIVYTTGTDVAAFSNAELLALSTLVLDSGRVKFTVYGFSRGDDNDPSTVDTVVLQVIGGTITYDAAGIMDATGDAKALLEYHYGSFEEDNNNNNNNNPDIPNRRRLARNNCDLDGLSGSSSGGFYEQAPTLGLVNEFSF